jgi:hypothetical protein
MIQEKSVKKGTELGRRKREKGNTKSIKPIQFLKQNSKC